MTVTVTIKQNGVQISEVRIEQLAREGRESCDLSLQTGIELVDTTQLRQRLVKMVSGVDGDIDNPMLQLLCCLEFMYHEDEMKNFTEPLKEIDQ